MQFLKNRSAFLNVKDESGQSAKPNNSKANETFIIGAGFGRTGTSSMQIALEKLGWRAFHMREVPKNGPKCSDAIIRAGQLKSALREKMKDYDASFKNFDQMVLSPDAFDWDQILKDPEFGVYNATVDFPLCAFYLDLMEYSKPNYKVILTVRDEPEQWYNSADKTLRQFHFIWRKYGLRFLQWVIGQDFRKMINVTYSHLVFDEPIGKHTDFWGDQSKCMLKYEDWIEGVKKYVPKDKLLVFNVKQGWDPLCDFLDVEAPNEPFPRSNETANMQKDIKMFNTIALVFNCTVGLLAVATGYCVLKKYKNM